MDPFIEGILAMARQSTVRTMTASGIVFQGPGYILNAHIAAGGAAADAALYEGTSTSGNKLMDLDTITNTSFHHRYWPPVYCATGLYLEVGTVQGVSIHYLELNP